MNQYLSEIVYGGVDGLITTFAIIAGSSGANFNKKVILVLGISSILADGFSMGVSSYLAEKVRTMGSNKSPINVGFITFLSFVLLGLMPLLPFLFNFFQKKPIKNQLDNQVENQIENQTKTKFIHQPMFYSTIIMCILLFSLGLVHGIQRAFETLAIGGAAAGISYYVAKKLSSSEKKN